MKKVLVAALLTVFWSADFSHAGDGKSGTWKGPCAVFAKACHGAGFRVGEAKSGKGLWKDCILKLVSGETVAGVTVEATDEQRSACKAELEKRLEKRRERREARRQQKAGADSATYEASSAH